MAAASAAALVFANSGDDPGDGDVEPNVRPHLRSVGGTERGDVPAAGLSALLVEDDPAMRLICVINLEAAGFRVTVATTGEEALALVAREQPDVVLLDVMLPDLGGFDVAERLPKIPIVFLSARGSGADLARGRAAGAIDYVTKPFDPIGLPERVREDLEELERTGSAEGVWTLRFGSD
jgi:DNA-binding response OmpR family regulator